MKQRREGKLSEFITFLDGKTTVPQSSLLLKKLWKYILKYQMRIYFKALFQVTLHEKIANGKSQIKTHKK